MNESQSKSKSVYSQQVEASIAIAEAALRFATELHHIEPAAAVAGFLSAAVKEAAIVTFSSDATADQARDAIQTLAEMLVAGFQGTYNDLVDKETKEVEDKAAVAAKVAAELASAATQGDPESRRPTLNEAQAALIASLAGASFCQACGHAHD